MEEMKTELTPEEKVLEEHVKQAILKINAAITLFNLIESNPGRFEITIKDKGVL